MEKKKKKTAVQYRVYSFNLLKKKNSSNEKRNKCFIVFSFSYFLK